MEPETRHSLHRFVGIMMIVITLPALVLFITRDQIQSWSVGSADTYDIIATPTNVPTDELMALGSGTCTWVSGAIQVVGAGLTSCRVSLWDADPEFNQQLSSDVRGISEGATAIFRFRESSNSRIEIAVGRSQVVIRQKSANLWTTLATVPRVSEVGSVKNPLTSVEISVVSDTVAVDLNGLALPRVKTQLLEEGVKSIAMASAEKVAVEFGSLIRDDADR